MADQRVDALYEVAADRFGESLRSVTAYDEDGLDVRYMRDDVASLYDEGDFGRVFRTLRLEAMNRPTQESLFVHDELLCTYRVFDGATEINVATSETTGYLVSVDEDATVAVRQTTDRLLDALGPLATTETENSDQAAGPADGDSAAETE